MNERVLKELEKTLKEHTSLCAILKQLHTGYKTGLLDMMTDKQVMEIILVYKTGLRAMFLEGGAQIKTYTDGK